MPILLQINVLANSGSTGKIAEEIGHLALLNGWRSIIAYGRWANKSRSELIRIGSEFSVCEHGVESRLLDNHGLASRFATKRLIRQIERIKPDIIHLHNIHGYYLNYQLLFDYLNSSCIPIVWTLHDCWSFTGHCTHFITSMCDRWKTECYNCPLVGDYPRAFVDRSRRNYKNKKRLFTSNNNLNLVTVCDWLADQVRQSFLCKKDVRVINNGINLKVFRPIPFDYYSRYQILGVSNVWYENKGLRDFYRLRESLDISQYEIVLVGLNKNQVNSLPKGIIGIERTESVEELVRIYSSSRVLVNPTYADTFPTVNIEAMACGTPVVTYKTGGSPEIINEKTGWVVDQGDIEAIVSIIKGENKKNKTEIEEQRRSCRRRAEECFDKDKCFSEYIRLYERLISK